MKVTTVYGKQHEKRVNATNLLTLETVLYAAN